MYSTISINITNMEVTKETNWQFIYKQRYCNEIKDFCRDILETRDNYSTLPKEKQLEVTKKYLKIFKETLKIFEIFFANNCYFISEDRLVVIYILSCNILKNGMLFYKLYSIMHKIDKREQCIKSTYFKNQYINIFKEINIFFYKRLEIEGSYGL